MSEKTKDIIDTLLCGLYMAVFCVPTIYLSIGSAKIFAWNTILTILLPILCGTLSAIAIYSERKTKSGIKWAVSVPISIALILGIGNTDLLMRIYKAVDPLYYSEYGGTSSMGEAFSGAAVMFLVLLAVFVGNIVGFGCSGIKFSTNTENVLAALRRYICPILCIFIVGIIIFLFCTLPQITPQYG